MRANHQYGVLVCTAGTPDTIQTNRDGGAYTGCVAAGTGVPLAYPAGSLAGCTWSAGRANCTTAAAHGLTDGALVTITGASPGGYNVTAATVLVSSSTAFSVALATSPGTYTSGGTVTASDGLTVSTATTGHAAGTGWTVAGTGVTGAGSFLGLGVGAVVQSALERMRNEVYVSDYQSFAYACENTARQIKLTTLVAAVPAMTCPATIHAEAGGIIQPAAGAVIGTVASVAANGTYPAIKTFTCTATCTTAPGELVTVMGTSPAGWDIAGLAVLGSPFSPTSNTFSVSWPVQPGTLVTGGTITATQSIVLSGGFDADSAQHFDESLGGVVRLTGPHQRLDPCGGALIRPLTWPMRSKHQKPSRPHLLMCPGSCLSSRGRSDVTSGSIFSARLP